MDKGNSLAANAACAIQRLRILPFTTGSALLQSQTDPHDRWKMECAFKLCTIHLPRSGGATSPGQMQRTVTRSLGLLVWPEVSSPDIADSASPPRFHPRYGLARKPRKSPSTLSAFAMFRREPRRTRQSSVLLHLLPGCQSIRRMLYPSGNLF